MLKRVEQSVCKGKTRVCVIEAGTAFSIAPTNSIHTPELPSRIFRPTNRNNNLFDVLVQATHRSRSRSVSPQKKAKTASNKTQVSSSSKNSTFKDKPTLGELPGSEDLIVSLLISESAKDESGLFSSSCDFKSI